MQILPLVILLKAVPKLLFFKDWKPFSDLQCGFIQRQGVSACFHQLCPLTYAVHLPPGAQWQGVFTEGNRVSSVFILLLFPAPLSPALWVCSQHLLLLFQNIHLWSGRRHCQQWPRAQEYMSLSKPLSESKWIAKCSPSKPVLSTLQVMESSGVKRAGDSFRADNRVPPLCLQPKARTLALSPPVHAVGKERLVPDTKSKGWLNEESHNAAPHLHPHGTSRCSPIWKITGVIPQPVVMNQCPRGYIWGAMKGGWSQQADCWCASISSIRAGMHGKLHRAAQTGKRLRGAFFKV